MSHENHHDPLAQLDKLSDWYVNTIWGKRVSDDDALFEVMSLQVFQAGLSWQMILNKRDGFRSGFGDWSINIVAGFGPAEVEALRNDPRIIRNRLAVLADVDLGYPTSLFLNHGISSSPLTETTSTWHSGVRFCKDYGVIGHANGCLPLTGRFCGKGRGTNG